MKIENDLKDYEELMRNHENFTKKFQNIDKNTTYTEINFTNSPLSLINNSFSFIGEWNSNIKSNVFLNFLNLAIFYLYFLEIYGHVQPNKRENCFGIEEG
jgi:hypothetical protein